ncbi:hypothetical protein SELSPUOL_01488 [Selenomonas sputigena ATCC 35185]|uniref:Uncharacterized protein n=1 Tax=Selenomonas sputigena (strain ATCC 35185 / DSM 20758 / CCUG 44933 / VPI D19B-28) TaxID=546271 RepID=C9LVJ4_SELS3|nr:hypothetical protein SELSPUOL_01488 [Selenomonas sputigena ATCC 35185]
MRQSCRAARGKGSDADLIAPMRNTITKFDKKTKSCYPICTK